MVITLPSYLMYAPSLGVYIRNTLRHRAGQSEGPEHDSPRSSDPMIEAGAPSTGQIGMCSRKVLCTPHRGYSWSHHWNPHTIDFD